LPERVKEVRRQEGVALVAELSDLRDNQPWHAENITVPAITAYGSLASPHHRRGMAYAAELLNCRVVELPDCRHDAPLSHPDLFRTAIVDPLLEAVGVPYTNAA
jgi:pimeloyl-ACP methyl ester carboxylesterase